MNNQITNNYIPSPVDTDNVLLPEELMALAEAISKNVHEVWAQNRMSEGWTYGPVRDDQKLQTPCLMRNFQKKRKPTIAIRLLPP